MCAARTRSPDDVSCHPERFSAKDLYAAKPGATCWHVLGRQSGRTYFAKRAIAGPNIGMDQRPNRAVALPIWLRLFIPFPNRPSETALVSAQSNPEPDPSSPNRPVAAPYFDVYEVFVRHSDT